MSEISIPRQPRILSKSQIFTYAIGVFGLMLPVALLSGYTFYFMVFVVGLNPIYASVANMINLFLNAFLAPVFGYVIDNRKPSKMGKRRPFLLMLVFPAAVVYIFTWFYPESLGINAIGQFGVMLIYTTSMALYAVLNIGLWSGYSSLLPEISTDEENRLKAASMQGFMMLLASILGIVFPFIIESMSAQNQDLIDAMFVVAIICSALLIISILITIFTIEEPVTSDLKNQNTQNTQDTHNSQVMNDISEKPKLSDSFRVMFKPLKNENFKNFEINNFIFSLGIRIPMTILIAIFTVVLEISDENLISSFLVVIPFAIIGFLVWTKMGSKKGLIETLNLNYIVLALLLLFSVVLLIPMPLIIKQILGLVIVSLTVMALIASYIIPNPLISHIIDEEIAKVIEKEGPFKNEADRYKFSGIFFGINGFLLNLAGGIAFLLIGAITNADENNPVLLIILLPITGIIVLIALIFVRKVKLSNIEQK